jgi:hypothetical protein
VSKTPEEQISDIRKANNMFDQVEFDALHAVAVKLKYQLQYTRSKYSVLQMTKVTKRTWGDPMHEWKVIFISDVFVDVQNFLHDREQAYDSVIKSIRGNLTSSQWLRLRELEELLVSGGIEDYDLDMKRINSLISLRDGVDSCLV